MKENPYPYGKVPTLSFVSTVYTLDDSPMKYLYKYLKLRTGDENDGVVTTRDGIIPNSDFIVKKKKKNISNF